MILDFSPRAIALDHLLRNLDDLGAPRGLDDLRAKYQRLREVGQVTPPRELALAAMEAGRDPWTDPEVVRAVVAVMARPNLDDLEQAEHAATMELYRSEAPAILAGWTKRFDEAARLVSEAVERNVDLDGDAREILNRGGDTAAVFVAARQAQDEMLRIMRGFRSLSTIVGVDPTDLADAYILADLPPEQWFERHRAQRSGREAASPTELAREGHRLRLPTFEDVKSMRALAHTAEAERKAGMHQRAVARVFG